MNKPMPKPGSSSYGRDQVVRIINSVLTKVGQAGEVSRESIYKELAELQDIIEAARREIGSARPGDIKDKHIPTATDELDAVVGATAAATGTIMDSCEVIETRAAAIGGESGEALAAEVTKIYEACSFQDITGQRITKVVSTLKTIEDKVDKLLSVLGDKMPGIEHAQGKEEGEEESTGDSLLNGPQLPGQAVTQADIDKLLAEFD